MVYVITALEFLPVSDVSLPVIICDLELQLSIPHSLSKLVLCMRGGVLCTIWSYVEVSYLLKEAYIANTRNDVSVTLGDSNKLCNSFKFTYTAMRL